MKKYVAWIDSDHYFVNSEKVSKIEIEYDCNIYDFLGICQYNFGESKEEAEAPLWALVDKADEIRDFLSS